MVELATLRQDVFAAIRTLLVANKPTYTYNSETVTYSIAAEYPEDNPSFPLIVINKPTVNDERITMDASTGDQVIDIQLDFYAKAIHGKKAIDAGQDSAMATIMGNISTFISSDKIAPMDDFWSDSGNSVIEDNNQTINTASSTMRWKLG